MDNNEITLEKEGILKPLLLSFAVIAGLVLLFHPFFGKLWLLWMENPSYTHGPIIPFVVAYLIWDKRSILSRMVIIPSYKSGLVSLLFFSIIWIIAVGGKSRFAIEFTFVLIIISLVLFNYGSAVTRKLMFPLFLLFMMIPLPAMVTARISRQLQLLSSKFGVAFMHLFDIPVYREGNIIHLPQTTLQVAEACSGISSLISLITLGMIYSYLSQKGVWRRVIITLCALPIAVFMNWCRIAVTGMIAHYWSLEYAQGFYHSFSGWIVFVVAFAVFLSIGALISFLFGSMEIKEQEIVD